MKLPREDEKLFFRLMWGLLLYVNQRRQIWPDIKSVEQYVALPLSEQTEVRSTLWENPDLIDAYVKENPDRLSLEERDIVGRWTRFVSGTFQIFRFLKKHTIFISDTSDVYGVLGLHESLEEMFFGQPLPIMVKGVLLPFKGKIVYDGVLGRYNVLFGGGIRSRLREEYMAAKQNERIITTLEPERAAGPRSKQRKPRKDWKPEVKEVVKLSEQMRGHGAVQSAAFGLLRASAKVALATVERPDELDELWSLARKAQRALSRMQTVLDRAEF